MLQWLLKIKYISHTQDREGSSQALKSEVVLLKAAIIYISLQGESMFFDDRTISKFALDLMYVRAILPIMHDSIIAEVILR